jgi:hypothetical protein
MERGQASVEYLAAVALLVLVLAGAGVAVAAPDLPGAVVAKLRLALCIVGGDVCRASDAADLGLEPCLVADESHERDSGISFLVFRAGGSDFWSVQRRSDGTVVLTEGYGQSLDASAGPELDLGPVHVGGSVAGGAGFRTGRSWTLSEARLRGLLHQTSGDPSKAGAWLRAVLGEPDETYVEGGGRGSAELAAEAIRSVPAAGASARGVLGRRKGRDGTTYYLDLGGGSSGPVTDVASGLDRTGHVVAEYRASDPPRITLRGTRRGHDGEETEVVMRLSLADPEDRAAARRVAFVALRDPALALRDLVARIRARGTVERLRYRTREEEGGWDYALGLGVSLGADHATASLQRELVDAEVIDGGVPAHRYDCVGS